MRLSDIGIAAGAALLAIVAVIVLEARRGPVEIERQQYLEDIERSREEREEKVSSSLSLSGRDTDDEKLQAALTARGDAAISWLELYDSRVTRLDFLSAKPFDSLRYLALSGTQLDIDDMEHIARHTELEGLELAGTGVSDSMLEKITGLHRLWDLDLRYTPLTDRGLDTVATLTSLAYLLLSNSRISSEGLKKLLPLRELNHLDVSGCDVGDGAVEHILALEGLESIDVRRTKISREGLLLLSDRLDGMLVDDEDTADFLNKHTGRDCAGTSDVADDMGWRPRKTDSAPAGTVPSGTPAASWGEGDAAGPGASAPDVGPAHGAGDE